MCLKELRDEFLYDCECRHLAKGSLRNYRASTRFLLEFLERKQITELEDVRPRHLRDLMKEKQDAGNTPRYINDLLKVWRTWFNYLVEEGYLEERDNPAKKVKPLRQPRTIIDTFTAAEMKRMIQFYDGKDMIVAASGDGILIADKERSGYMKPYVEKIETEAMYAEKSWGTYTVIDVQPGSMTVKISMRAGEHMSYHMHNYREEVWTVVSGKGKAIVDGMEQVLRTGDVITIAAGCKHTVEAITALDMIEVQLGEEISVTDKIKFPMD